MPESGAPRMEGYLRDEGGSLKEATVFKKTMSFDQWGEGEATYALRFDDPSSTLRDALVGEVTIKTKAWHHADLAILYHALDAWAKLVEREIGK